MGDCFSYNNSAWRLNYCVGLPCSQHTLTAAITRPVSAGLWVETASSTTTAHGGSTTVWVCHVHSTHQQHKVPLPVSAGLWVGDCFIYNNSAWRLNHCVGLPCSQHSPTAAITSSCVLQACGWETASFTTTAHGGSTTVWVCHVQSTHQQHKVPLPVSAGLWVGDCFIYNNSAWRLNYCVGLPCSQHSPTA